MNASTPTNKRHKWLFWLILAAFSTFFAEVFAGSYLFPFSDIFGILVVVPLYGLHTILLITIIFRYGKPRLSTLVFAGVLFGLYEAYMTKVLWQPTWDAIVITGGVAPVEILVLVVWWHTWFSFITPLVVSETLLTNSQAILSGLPKRLQHFFSGWKGYLALAVFGSVFQGINSPSPLTSLFAGLSTTGVLIALVLLWRRVTRERSYAFQELLPNKKEFRVLFIWLLLMYIIEGLGIRPEALPGIAPQAIIWAIYAFALIFFYLSLKKTRHLEDHAPNPRRPALAGKTWIFLAIAFTATAVIAKLLLAAWIGMIIMSAWVGGIVFSLSMLFKAMKEIA